MIEYTHHGSGPTWKHVWALEFGNTLFYFNLETGELCINTQGNKHFLSSKTVIDVAKRALKVLPGRPPSQSDISEWIVSLFGERAAEDGEERCQRFLEEALELTQATGNLSREQAHKLVDYVYDRKVGDPEQELGGAALTLLALASQMGFDLQEALEKEFSRASNPEVREKILSSQRRKAAAGVGGDFESR